MSISWHSEQVFPVKPHPLLKMQHFSSALLNDLLRLLSVQISLALPLLMDFSLNGCWISAPAGFRMKLQRQRFSGLVSLLHYYLGRLQLTGFQLRNDHLWTDTPLIWAITLLTHGSQASSRDRKLLSFWGLQRAASTAEGSGVTHQTPYRCEESAHVCCRAPRGKCTLTLYKHTSWDARRRNAGNLV